MGELFIQSEARVRVPAAARPDVARAVAPFARAPVSWADFEVDEEGGALVGLRYTSDKLPPATGPEALLPLLRAIAPYVEPKGALRFRYDERIWTYAFDGRTCKLTSRAAPAERPPADPREAAMRHAWRHDYDKAIATLDRALAKAALPLDVRVGALADKASYLQSARRPDDRALVERELRARIDAACAVETVTGAERAALLDRKAGSLARDQRHALAVEARRAALALQESPLRWAALAHALEAAGQLDEAEEAFRRGEDHVEEAGFVTRHYRWASALAMADRYAAATGDDRYALWRSEALLYLGRYAEITPLPDNAHAAAVLAICAEASLRLGHPARALAELDAASGGDARLRAEILRALGRAAEAAELLEGELARATGAWRGVLLVALGRPAAAVADLELALRQRTNYMTRGSPYLFSAIALRDVLVAAGAAFAAVGRPEEARAALDDALAMTPHEPAALRLRAALGD